MSERYLVLVEFPLVVNPLRLKFSGKPFIRNYRWERDRGVRFHVVDKETGHVARTAESRPVFAFHHVSAFEEGDDVVVDIVAFPDSGVIDQLYLERLRSAELVTATGNLTRFRIGSRGDVSDERAVGGPDRIPTYQLPASCRTAVPLRVRGWEPGARKLHRQPREVGPRA